MHGRKKNLDLKDVADSLSRYTKSLNAVHPINVKPLGNYYLDFVEGIKPIRNTGFGNFAWLLDEMILDILSLVEDFRDIVRLSMVSRAMYCFCFLDDIWKELTLDIFNGNFSFDRSWRRTFFTQYQRNKGMIGDTDEEEPLRFQGMYSDVLFARWMAGNIDLHVWAPNETIPRRSNLSLEEFLEEYGIPNKPVILTDVVNKWPAFTEWTADKLSKNYGEVPMKTDQGVTMKMNEYLTYCMQTRERSPMYLFDNDFGEKCPQMLKEYEVPEFFQEDFFSVLGEKDRPSFRWILVGPPRSGSGFHKDPNATSAWNGLISGAKKWIMFPPDRVPPGVFPSPDGWEVTTPESVVEWFIDFYHEAQSGSFKPYECVQRPGDLIFIPSTWWHAALNLEVSIAVTQNVVSTQNFMRVLNFLESKKNPELCRQFLAGMESTHPGILEKLKAREREIQSKRKRSMWEVVSEEKSSGFSFNFADSDE